MSKSLALKPRISEKTYALSEERNVYVFEVPYGASKQLVAHAVTDQYDVTVTKVRVAAVPGKTTRTNLKGGRASQVGKRAGIRKAYVTLKAGDKLPIFAAVEDTPEEKPAKAKKEKK